MKKIMALLVSFCIMTSIFAGCGSESASNSTGGSEASQSSQAQQQDSSNKEEKEVTIKAFFNSLDHESYLKPLNDAFMEKYPNIKIQFDTPGSTAYETVLKTKLASGDAPDMMSVWPGGLMADYAAAGHLLDITGQAYTDRLTDLVKNEYTFKDKLYGVGWNATSEGVYYNKKIFANLNIQQPTNWDEFLAACETIKQAGITPIASGFKDDWTIIRVVNSAYSTLVFGRNPDFDNKLVKGEIDFNDKNVLEVYQKFGTLLDKGYFDKTPLSTDYNLANTMFTQGKAAMVIQGGWALAALREASKDNADIDIGFMPFPVNNKDEQLLGCWHVEVGMAGSAKTEHPDAVNKYFDFFTSKDVYSGYLTEKKVYPVTKDANVQIDPEMDKFVADYVTTGKVTTWAHEIWPNAMTNDWKKKLQEFAIGQLSAEDMCKWLTDTYAKSENLYK